MEMGTVWKYIVLCSSIGSSAGDHLRVDSELSHGNGRNMILSASLILVRNCADNNYFLSEYKCFIQFLVFSFPVSRGYCHYHICTFAWYFFCTKRIKIFGSVHIHVLEPRRRVSQSKLIDTGRLEEEDYGILSLSNLSIVGKILNLTYRNWCNYKWLLKYSSYVWD